MSGGVEGLVSQVERTRAELSQALSDPDVASDRKRYADLTRRYAGLEEAAQLSARWRDASGRAAEAREMLAEGEDEDFRALLKEAEAEVDELEPLIRTAMVEPDPNDARDVIVEIRGGTGGEEAALFARDLLDIYQRYATARGYKVELLDVSEAVAQLVARELVTTVLALAVHPLEGLVEPLVLVHDLALNHLLRRPELLLRHARP